MEEALDFDDVLIKPTRTAVESRTEVNLEVTFTTWKHATQQWSGVPICIGNSQHVGTFPMARMLTPLKFLSIIRKDEPIQDWKVAVQTMDPSYLCPTIGIENNKEQVDFLRQIMALHKDLKFICIDSTNGYQLKMLNTIRKVRTVFPNKIIIAGNVCTPEGVGALLDAGADIVKLGIGVEDTDISRSLTGVGHSQFSTIVLCSATANASGGYIMADGGFSSPGDISKALGAGAHFACVTSMFDGHEECDGTTIERVFKTGEMLGDQEALVARKYKSFFSKDFLDSKDFPYRGPVIQTGNLIRDCLADTCIMVNARKLTDLPRHVTFIRTSTKQRKLDLTNNQFERKITSVGVLDKCNHQFPSNYKEGNE